MTLIKDEKKVTKQDIVKNRDAKRERDNELVTGIFYYTERPGSILSFRFKKYAGDDYKEYNLQHGERYKLPRMVARHLNKDVHYTKYTQLDNSSMQAGAQGQKSRFEDGSRRKQHGMSMQEKVHRCEFRSLEFMDEDLDLIPSNITMVTSTN